MRLPEGVAQCIRLLEEAGFAAYAVGGCVRDALLGLTPQDYDLCTNATPPQLKQVFSGFRQVLAGEKHGTVGVVTEAGVVEITTFRVEGTYRDSRHPDCVTFVEDITQDLSRRDFTVNAMAYSPTRGYADPFSGREDLASGILRAVGDPQLRFQEDALRILRGMRFSVRYRLQIEDKTLQALKANAPLLELLARERIFSELCKLLPLVSCEDLLRFAPILGVVIPELGATVGFDQRNPHHTYDLYTHTAQVTGAVPPELPLRLAALLHDIGKVPTMTLDAQGQGHFLGHAKVSAQMADAVLLRLKAPTALRSQVTELIARHMTPLEPDKRLLRRRIGQYGMEGVQQLLHLQAADFYGKNGQTHPLFQLLAQLLEEIAGEQACFGVKDLQINGNDLLALGYPSGKAVGQGLSALLAQVQSETLSNEPAALLQAAEAYLERLKEKPL